MTKKGSVKRVNGRIKRFAYQAVDFLLPKLIPIGLALSAWAIFSIEIPLIPKVPCVLSDSTIAGWNKVFLALSYSFIAGVIVYWFTSSFPYIQKKRRIKPIVDARIKDIGTQLMDMNFEFRGTTSVKIDQIDEIMKLFNNEHWKEKCVMPQHIACKDVTEAFFQDHSELQSMVGQLINDYKDYLTTNQLFLLECLRGGQIGFYASISKASVFSDKFYEIILQPEYKKLLECYNVLVAL